MPRARASHHVKVPIEISPHTFRPLLDTDLILAVCGRMPPCTCKRERIPERLLFKFYEPLESKTIFVQVTSD
jgi:hypothetical protein